MHVKVNETLAIKINTGETLKENMSQSTHQSRVFPCVKGKKKNFRKSMTKSQNNFDIMMLTKKEKAKRER